MPPRAMQHPELGDLLNGLTGEIVDAFVEVHRTMGPGFKELHYQEALAHELSLRGLAFQREERLEVAYKGRPLSAPLRLDFLVESKVIVQVKAVETLLPLHQSQLLRYLRVSGRKVGLLVNFNAPHLGGQIKRVAA